jgi:hypothetical protein
VTRKAVIAVVAVGAVVVLRPLAGRVGHRMVEHCGLTAEQCKQMAEVRSRGEAIGRT